MKAENKGAERLSKRLSLMAMADPDSLEKIAAILQVDLKELRNDILELEACTGWQDDPETAEKWHARGREFFNAGQDKEAFLCFCKGAENGHSEDQFIAGCCLAEGRGIKQNDELALHCYQKAALSGSVDAMYHLGLCYEQGIGTERDFDAAQLWFKKAAEAGYQPKIVPVEPISEEENVHPSETEAEVSSTAQDTASRPEMNPMEKKAAKMLEAMGVHLSDEDIRQLNDSIKDNKPFPEMVRNFSGMIYKDNPQMKGIFDSVSDETISSWKDVIDNLLKGGTDSN